MISKDYECENQITIADFMAKTKTPEYGDRSCEVCYWVDADGTCRWASYARNTKDRTKPSFKYPTCEGYGSFMPSNYEIPRMCGNCKHSNQFEYDTKPEYEEQLKKHNGYTRESADDPVEDANIYCTHPEGSLNRRTLYKDCEEAGFGIGHWDRQHEYDTCDRWEKDGVHID